MKTKKKINSSLNDKSVPIDYSKDPFFIKKREMAQREIDQFGIPKEFLEKKK